MSNWNLGSFASEILLIVESVPTSAPTISGIPLMNIVERNINFVEKYTGNSIGSTSVGLDYQGPVLDLSIADTLELMNIQGTDVSSISLGEFSTSKGGESNLVVVAKNFREVGMR